MNPLISVVMSVYNEELEWIQKSVCSILEQTYLEIEFIIVLDNPNIDNNIKNYLYTVSGKDHRVKIIENKQNLGLAKSLNKGISLAQGKYIARMDADDIAATDRIQCELNELIQKNLDIVSSGKIEINEEDFEISKYKRCITTNDKIKKILPYTNCIVHPSVIIKKEILDQLGGYRDFKQSQDYDLWLRMLSAGCTFGNIDEPLLKYRIRSQSISVSRAYCQYLTACYQVKLYRQRKRTGKDTFCPTDFDKYLKQRKGFDRERNKKYALCTHTLNEGLREIKNKNPIKGTAKVIVAIIKFPILISVLYKKVKIYAILHRN